MSSAPRPQRPVIVVRILALLTVVLAVMCAALAMAWQDEREQAACWRIAAEFQQQPEGGCGG
jgi:hypothetical protein